MTQMLRSHGNVGTGREVDPAQGRYAVGGWLHLGVEGGIDALQLTDRFRHGPPLDGARVVSICYDVISEISHSYRICQHFRNLIFLFSVSALLAFNLASIFFFKFVVKASIVE